MKRILLAVALMFSTSAFAIGPSCEITGSGLPKEVVQKLKADCEKLRLDQAQKEALEEAGGGVPMITPEKVTGWAQVAEGFANAMGAAARQLNISVNEFIKTPAGMITIGVILWKVIGVSILKLLAMYLVLVATLALLRSMWRVGSVTVERSFLWWKWTKEKPVYATWKEATDSMCGVGLLVIVCSGIAELSLLLSLV